MANLQFHMRPSSLHSHIADYCIQYICRVVNEIAQPKSLGLK
ncbi:unnamed protein product [Schistosoma curassoni]|uniref:Uncharacterized protein n=1 Tax=Schistosoma curassoni TaxID=6186 RepID=A0A183K2Y4_9TREM|nr:unnamed protein product [Schistosoma curassoni]